MDKMETSLKCFKITPLSDLETYESEWTSCCNGSGIYILYLQNKVIYVGRSVDVRKRLYWHIHVHKGVYFDAFSILQEKGVLEQRILELLYINFLHPSKNGGIGGFGTK